MIIMLSIRGAAATPHISQVSAQASKYKFSKKTETL